MEGLRPESNFMRGAPCVDLLRNSLNAFAVAWKSRATRRLDTAYWRLDRPFGAAGVAIKTNEGRCPRHRHGRMTVIPIAQVHRDHASAPAIRATSIAMQSAGALKQRFTAFRQLVSRKGNTGVPTRRV